MDQIQELWKVIGPTFMNWLTVSAIPAIVLLVKSERMALDKTSQANGVVHYFKLANKALKVVEIANNDYNTET